MRRVQGLDPASSGLAGCFVVGLQTASFCLLSSIQRDLSHLMSCAMAIVSPVHTAVDE